LARMIALTNRNLPLSAACYDGHSLKLRLAGVESGLAAVRKQLGDDSMPPVEAACFWQDWREHRLPFFQDATPLWRLSLPAATPLVHSSSVSILDWGGALRWLKTSVSDDAIQTEACRLGGHATRFRAAQGGLFQPLPPALETLHKKLKNAFDPVGIFNVGRMYPGW
jgi:glycolate oxidase FAD binding subunit